jgi:hypothetical protein
MALKISGKEAHDVVWGVSLTGPGRTGGQMEKVRLLGEVTSVKLIEKPKRAVTAPSARDNVEDAVQKEVAAGGLKGIDFQRLTRGTYMIGGSRRQLSVQNNNILVRGPPSCLPPCSSFNDRCTASPWSELLFSFFGGVSVRQRNVLPSRAEVRCGQAPTTPRNAALRPNSAP